MPGQTRLAWAVSGQGRALQAVMAAVDAGLLPVEVCLIVTDRASPLEELARTRGVPYLQVTPWDDRSSGVLIDALAKQGIAWLGLTFGRLLRDDVIDHLEGRIFNLHFSLLPLFPGTLAPRSISQALDAGMRLTGVTVHMVDQTTDGGHILGQAICAVTSIDTRETLGTRMFGVALPLLLQVVRAIGAGELVHDSVRKTWDWPRARIAPHAPVSVFPAVDKDIEEFAMAFCAKLQT